MGPDLGLDRAEASMDRPEALPLIDRPEALPFEVAAVPPASGAVADRIVKTSIVAVLRILGVVADRIVIRIVGASRGLKVVAVPIVMSNNVAMPGHRGRDVFQATVRRPGCVALGMDARRGKTARTRRAQIRRRRTAPTPVVITPTPVVIAPTPVVITPTAGQGDNARLEVHVVVTPGTRVKTRPGDPWPVSTRHVGAVHQPLIAEARHGPPGTVAPPDLEACVGGPSGGVPACVTPDAAEL